MNDFVSEELISAYLDGELTAEEQRLVESMLRENERCRQIHEEFAAIRAALQSLPREELDADFSRRVLVRVQSFNTESVVPPSKNDVSPPTTSETAVRVEVANKERRNSPGLSESAIPNQRRQWRMAFYIAAAVALFALLATPSYQLFNVLRSPEREPVAQGEREVDAGYDEPAPDDLAAPQEPSAAVVEATPNDTPPPSASVVSQPPQADTPETSPSTALANNPVEPPRETNFEPAVAAANSAPTEQPQQMAARSMASARPRERSATRLPTADLALEYGRPDLHVIRIAVSEEALRNSWLDQALEEAGITFGAAGGRPQPARRPDERLPAVDVVLVGAAPSQLEEVFASLRKHPEDFRPTHVYTASFERMLDWVLAIADNILNTPPDPQSPKVTPPATPLVDAGASWDGFLQMAMSSEQRIYAFRAPLDRAAIDKLFPIPQEPIAARPRQKPVNDDPVQAIFILMREP